jgi:hypothetical protein
MEHDVAVLADVHVDGDEPHVVIRFGSWDPVKERYRAPKGKAGEKSHVASRSGGRASRP